MVVLGIILLAVVAVTTVVALLEGDDSTSLNLVGANLDTTTRWVFVAGAVSMILLVAGLALIAAGLRRARARRKEMKTLKTAATNTSTPPPPETEASRVPVSPQDPDEQTHFQSTPRE